MTDVEERDLYRRADDPAPSRVPLWRVQAELVLVLVGVLVLVLGVGVVLWAAR